MERIILLRHPKPIDDPADHDPDLGPPGLQHATRLALSFKNLNPDTIYATRTQRTQRALLVARNQFNGSARYETLNLYHEGQAIDVRAAEQALRNQPIGLDDITQPDVVILQHVIKSIPETLRHLAASPGKIGVIYGHGSLIQLYEAILQVGRDDTASVLEAYQSIRKKRVVPYGTGLDFTRRCDTLVLSHLNKPYFNPLELVA